MAALPAVVANHFNLGRHATCTKNKRRGCRRSAREAYRLRLPARDAVVRELHILSAMLHSWISARAVSMWYLWLCCVAEEYDAAISCISYHVTS
jgi:hypothetical protein